MEWSDIDITDDLGKEAAKTILALDYYLKACDKEKKTKKFSNAKLNEFDLNESIASQQDIEPVRSLSPEIPEQYRTLTHSFIKRPKKNMYATGGGFKLKEKKPGRNRNVLATTSFTSSRHRYSRDNVPMNRFREYSTGTKSIFSSYVEAELKKQLRSGETSPNLPSLPQYDKFMKNM